MWSVPFMILLLGALAVHETRPYKVRLQYAVHAHCMLGVSGTPSLHICSTAEVTLVADVLGEH